MAEETEATTGRSQIWKHEDAAGWLTSEGHINAKSSQAEVIAAFAAHRNEYRRTDRYRKLVDGHAETALAEQAAAKVVRDAEKAKAKEAAAKEAAAKSAKAEKAAPAKATKAPAKAAPKAAGKGKGKAESPFD